MSKSSSLSSKRVEQAAAETRKKWISIAAGVGVVLLIAALYFFWPKAPSATETKPTALNATELAATGLVIQDLVIGGGREAKTGDSLTVGYTGWLHDGVTKFDSSSNHEKPLQFILGRGDVIEGWDLGLVGMKVGGKRKLIIPPALGYGETGALGARIPPNETLVFEVELLDVLGPVAATLPPSMVMELKIEDLVVGTGAEAKAGDTVSVHYTGWLENGTKFDSSLDSGQPIEFVLGTGRVIKGWDQGLLGLKVGGKRKLTIPASLGYGEFGAGDLIPPHATLIFEVELVAIK
jgi:peptidylprolyl isomerase